MEWNKKYSKRMERVTPSAIMEILKAVTQSKFINFATGLPDADFFPREDLQKLCNEIFQQEGKVALQYSAAEGYGNLRTFIAERLTQCGEKTSADNILITHGSQQGLDLAARVLLDPGDRVIIESPSYLAGIQIFDSYQVEYLPVSMDSEGMFVDSVEELIKVRAPKMIYTLPNFQNPTGITLSLKRREKLVALAERYGIPILEDNAYGDLRYVGDLIPSLRAFKGGEIVLSTGTFSKTIAPGIRVGWIAAEKELIDRLSQVKQITDLHTNTFWQRVVYKYCASGQLDPQIQRLCKAYKKKRDGLLQALERYLPKEVSWTHPEGGMFLLLTLPDSVDAEKVLKAAMEQKKVAFIPGRTFFPGGGGHNTLRLNFVSPKPEEIEEGIQKLAEVL
jgi:2-aminoadipate transaminase